MKEKICDQCGALRSSFKDSHQYLEHCRKHTKIFEDHFDCDECPKTFVIKNYLKWYEIKAHGENVNNF